MASSGSPSVRGRVAGFDGLRAVSALLVFFEHKVSDFGTGVVGVWIFFCLSGYLIVGILHRARRSVETSPAEASAGRAFAHFWRNRVLRIFPIYYAVLVAVFVLTERLETREFLHYSLYLQNFHIAFVARAWNSVSHFWSLAIEQQFYLFSALCLIALPSGFHARFLGGVLVASLIATVAGNVLGWDPFAATLMPWTNFAFMALGGLASVPGPFERFRDTVTRTSVLVAAAVAFAISFAGTRSSYHPLGGMPLAVYASGLAFSGLIVAWVARNQDAALVRLLETRPLRWLGTTSYGFYVLHPFVPDRDSVARFTGVAVFGEIPRPAWILVELAVALVLSHLSFRYFESRFLSLKYAPRPAAASAS